MSESNLNQFIPLVLGDPALQDQLRGLKGTDVFVQTVVRMGEEHGFEFTSDDVQKAMQQHTGKATRDLTDAELAQITGGATMSTKEQMCQTRVSSGWGC